MADEIKLKDLQGLEQDEMLEKLLKPLNEFITSTKQKLKGFKLQNIRIFEIDVTAGEHPWVTVGGSDSLSPSFINGWTNMDASHESVGFRINSDGIVQLRGNMSSGSLDVSAFQLPVGYRPALEVQFVSITNMVHGWLVITTDGHVVPGASFVGSNVWYSLESVFFRAATPAKPTPYVGIDWPIRLKHELHGKIIGVTPISCTVVKGTPDDTALLPNIFWHDDGNGYVSIVAASGLTAGVRYNIRFLLIGE